MSTRGKLDRGVFEMVDTESMVPKDHLLWKINAAVNWAQLYDIVEELYCDDNRRPGFNSVVLYKERIDICA